MKVDLRQFSCKMRKIYRIGRAATRWDDMISEQMNYQAEIGEFPEGEIKSDTEDNILCNKVHYRWQEDLNSE